MAAAAHAYCSGPFFQLPRCRDAPSSSPCRWPRLSTASPCLVGAACKATVLGGRLLHTVSMMQTPSGAQGLATGMCSLCECQGAASAGTGARGTRCNLAVCGLPNTAAPLRTFRSRLWCNRSLWGLLLLQQDACAGTTVHSGVAVRVRRAYVAARCWQSHGSTKEQVA